MMSCFVASESCGGYYGRIETLFQCIDFHSDKRRCHREKPACFVVLTGEGPKRVDIRHTTERKSERCAILEDAISGVFNTNEAIIQSLNSHAVLREDAVGTGARGARKISQMRQRGAFRRSGLLNNSRQGVVLAPVRHIHHMIVLGITRRRRHLHEDGARRIRSPAVSEAESAK